MCEIKMIACLSLDDAIGVDNDLVVKIPEDMKRFKEMTSGNVVVMGRKTFESMGNRPLPKRVNIVITSKPELYEQKENLYFVNSIDDAINLGTDIAEHLKCSIYLIGGKSIYEEGAVYADTFYVTRAKVVCESGDAIRLDVEKIKNSMNVDAVVNKDWDVSTNGTEYRYETFVRNS